MRIELMLPSCRRQFQRLRLMASVVIVSIPVAGCMTLSPDGGMSSLVLVADRELGKEIVKSDSPAQEEYVRQRVQALLKGGLTADTAVQIALLNNRGLQSAFNELAIAEAKLVQSATPPNPKVSLARLATGGTGVEIERQLLLNVLALFSQPQRQGIAEARLREAQLRAAEKILRLAADTRRAWHTAVATHQRVHFLQGAQVNARTVSQLFKKLGETGAVNKLDQAREHVFFAELTARLGKARLDYRADREGLIRLMGLWGDQTAFALPTRIQPLPSSPVARPAVERDAVARNIRIAAARAELEATIKTHRLTHATRYVNLLEVSALSASERSKSLDPDTGQIEKEKSTTRAIEVEFQLPIFDQGAARTREAEESVKRAVNRLLETAVDVRSQARESYQRYRGAHTLARHYQRAVLPLRKTIAEESMLRYNAMIVDVFPILAEARERINSNISAIDAVRDFWLAEASLRAAIVGGGAGAGAPSGEDGAMANSASPADH